MCEPMRDFLNFLIFLPQSTLTFPFTWQVNRHFFHFRRWETKPKISLQKKQRQKISTGSTFRVNISIFITVSEKTMKI